VLTGSAKPVVPQGSAGGEKPRKGSRISREMRVVDGEIDFGAQQAVTPLRE